MTADLGIIHRQYGSNLRGIVISLLNQWMPWYPDELPDIIIAETYVTMASQRMLETTTCSVPTVMYRAARWALGRYLQDQSAKKRGGGGQRDKRTKQQQKAYNVAYDDEYEWGVTGAGGGIGAYSIQQCTGTYDDAILRRLEYEQALAACSPEARKAVSLRVHGYSQPDIAKALTCSRQAVDTMHRQARRSYLNVGDST